MRIIPAIDILDGKCVRLTKGDYSTRKTYNENPLEVAREFADNGIRYLHLVDLDGARKKHVVNHRVLYEICNKTSLKVDFGGGVKSNDDIHIAFENGASQVTGGSVAVSDPDLFIGWIAKYGPEKIILGADCLNRMIHTNGWTRGSELDVLEFIKGYEEKGVSYVICTDISLDGMLQGASLELYTDIIKNTGTRLIASGGVSSLSDLQGLKAAGCEGAIVGKALYEQKISLKDISKLC